MKTTYTEFRFENRDEWLNARGIGGSDLATIMGEGKWQTIQDVFNRLCYPDRCKKNNLDKNPRVQEGAQAEEFIRNLWALEHPKYKVIAPPKGNWLFVKNNNKYMTVSPDGLLNEDYTGAIEIKDVEVYSERQLQNWKDAVIPPQYFYQIMQYFIVINTIQEIYLIARIKVMKNKELDHVEEYNYHFTRSEFKDKIKECEKVEKAFIKKYIIPQIRPNNDYLKEILC